MRHLSVVVVALLALSVVQLTHGDASEDHSIFEEDLATFVEMEAEMQVDMEMEMEKQIYPIIDNTGTDSFTPKANLTRFSVKPVIDATMRPDLPSFLETAPAQPVVRRPATTRTAAPRPVAPRPAAPRPATASAPPPVAPRPVTSAGGPIGPTPSGFPTASGSAVLAAGAGVQAASGAAAVAPRTIGGQVMKGIVGFLDGSWLQWLAKHAKKYTPAQNAIRGAIWLANKAKAAAMNTFNAGRYGVGGPFADLDPAEFKAKLLGARPTIAIGARDSFIELVAAFPNDRREGEVFVETEADMAALADAEAEAEGPVAPAPNDVIDWRSKCTPVKTQQTCGSCWAITAVSVLESAIARSGKPLASLSAQQLVDCNREGNDGCSTGSFANAFAYLKTHGATSKESYPYLNKQDTCKMPNGGKGPKVASAGFAVPWCPNAGDCKEQLAVEPNLPAKLRQYGPLAAVIDAALMQFYEGGIINSNSGCLKDWNSMNHAVVIVGYNAAEKYWILRNSWGPLWGESGYFRLAYGANTCGMVNFVQYITV